MVVLVSAAAAFLFAAGSVTAKRGMQHTNAISALAVSSTVATVILAIAAALDPPDRITVSSILFFVAAGLVGDGVGRFSLLGAVDRAGPVVAIPVQTAAYPVIAIAGGVLILSETITTVQILGAITVVAGIWVLLAPASDATGTPRVAAADPRLHRWPAVALAALAGVSFASSDLLRKSGLEDTPNPAFGALVAVGGILILGAVAASLSPTLRRQIHAGPDWVWLVAAGTCIAGALLAVFKALEMGSVSTVGPIIAAQPLAVVVLSWALLRNLERITLRMVIGAVMVVIGVIGIALGV